jgi:hypothetical protein
VPIDEKRIERAARAICAAKGIDPDARTQIGWKFNVTQPKNKAFGPAWMNERETALAILAVLDEEKP